VVGRAGRGSLDASGLRTMNWHLCLRASGAISRGPPDASGLRAINWHLRAWGHNENREGWLRDGLCKRKG